MQFHAPSYASLSRDDRDPGSTLFLFWRTNFKRTPSGSEWPLAHTNPVPGDVVLWIHRL